MGFEQQRTSRDSASAPWLRPARASPDPAHSFGSALTCDAFQSETYSVHGLILQSLGKTQLRTLNDSVSSLLTKRQQESSAVECVRVPSSPGDRLPSLTLHVPSSPHTYKVPPRLVLHETKKQAYIADLANPAIPLHRLSRSIPHGFKGVDLLEMLSNNDVALDRALWFIKVCGGSELVRPPSSLCPLFGPSSSSGR